MKKNLKMIPYLLVQVIAFYLLPIIIQDTGSAMIVMLIGLPIICLITSFVFGIRNSVNWLYPVMVALLFTPSVFLFYNGTATIYILAYSAIALTGSLMGKLTNKSTN